MYRLFAIAMIACSALYAADSSLAYNKPARADASKQNCRSPYGVFVDASFLYWYAAQDGMTIAYSGDDVDSLGTYPSPVVVFLNQPFEYKPGFKVGVGYSAKEWEAKAEYTWIRNQTSVSAGVSGNPTFGEGNIPVWVSDWFASGYIPTQNISSSWKLSIDRLDVMQESERFGFDNRFSSRSRFRWAARGLLRELFLIVIRIAGGLGLFVESAAAVRSELGLLWKQMQEPASFSHNTRLFPARKTM